MSRLSLSRRLTVLATAAASLMFAGTTVSQAAAHRAAAPGLGHWTELGATQNAPPELWLGPDHRAWVVWSPPPHGVYKLAIVSPTGKVGKPSTIIKGWGGVSFQPTLLSNGKSPLLIFSGQKGTTGSLSEGCVVGALPASPQWQVQTWSLSSNCAFSNVGYGDAAENKSGVLSAGWAGGAGVEYRNGKSPTIPATGKDSQITLTLSHGGSVALANNSAGNGHTSLVFFRFFSKNAGKDGVYVKDLNASSAPARAPKSGTESVGFAANQRAAIASPNAHGGGIYVAYCTNKANCPTYLLWKVGAKNATTVPGTKLAIGLTMSTGPDGRLWLAWYNETQNRVTVIRTNKADSRFGPSRSFPVPKQCIQSGNTHLALTSGNSGRVDMGLTCLNGQSAVSFVTQSEASLSISAKPGKITNTHSNKVTFTVNDAGDPVAGAKVKIAGKSLTTSKNGTVSFTFAKGAKPGTYTATASAADYFSGTTTVKVSS